MKNKEDIVEKDIEGVLPKKFVKEVRKHPFVYLVGAIVAILAIAGLSGWLYVANGNLNEQKDLIAGLNVDLQEKANQLEILEGNLSKSEEGRKQIEAAKVESDAKVISEGDRANTAESQTAKAKSDLNNTQSQLNAKRAELIAVNRCVSLFGSVQSLIGIYENNTINASIYTLKAIQAALDRNYTLGSSYLVTARSYQDTAGGYYSQIQSTLRQVRSGNC